MKHLSVQTAQNVPLEFVVGNVGKRLVAAILDLVAMLVYFYIAQYIVTSLMAIELWEAPDLNILAFFIISLPIILYQPICEYFWNGRTVGKALMKLQVIRVDGQMPSLSDLILRWLLRVIDVRLGFLFIFFIPSSPSSSAQETFMIWVMILMVVPMPIVGIISMATSKKGQRLGDQIANTAVIEVKRHYSLDQTILQATGEDYQPRFLNVLKLRDKDIHIIKTTLDDLEKSNNHKYVHELSKKAREILEIKEEMKPVLMLQTLLKDYNYLARKKDSQ